MYVDRATYSFRMSFWTVPRSDGRAMPRASPVATYRASRIAAVALIVMLVLTRSRGRPSRSVCISSRVEIATPTRPTSPRTIGASLSYPIWVGKSNATLRPSFPWAKRYLNRRFVSFAVPKPAYWRIVHRRPRYIVARIPRVNGGSPGNPRRFRYSPTLRSRGLVTTSNGRPLPVVLAEVPTASAAFVAGAERRFVFRRVAIGFLSVAGPGEAERGHGDSGPANDLPHYSGVHVGTQRA